MCFFNLIENLIKRVGKVRSWVAFSTLVDGWATERAFITARLLQLLGGFLNSKIAFLPDYRLETHISS